MKKLVMMIVFAAMVAMALNAASTHLSLDNRTGTRDANATERIRLSPMWETDAEGAMAVVSANGVVVKTATEVGVYEWMPTQGGTYEFAHTVFVNGVQVGKTLTATFVVKGLSVEPCAVDWMEGSIEIGWTRNLPAEEGAVVSYDVYWSSQTNGTDHIVKKGVAALSCTDDAYLDHGDGDDGVSPIYYTVVCTDGSIGCCLTRRRFGIAVGYSAYATDDPPLEQAYNDAELFHSLCASRGGFGDEDMKFLANSNAKVGDIRSEINSMSEKVKSGDTFVFYISTHGHSYYYGAEVFSPKVYQSGLAAYNGTYLVKDLQTDIRFFPQGARVICIIMACHSASLTGTPLDDEDKSLSDRVDAWLANCGFAQCLGNVAWVVSCGVNQSSYNSRNNSLFGEYFIDNGWSKGYADCKLINSPTYTGVESDGRVTFLDLAKYAQCFAVGLSDLVEKKFLEASKSKRADVTFENEGLLGSAVAGTSPSPNPVKPARVDGLTVTPVGSSSLKIAWQQASGAQQYRIFRYPAGDEKSKICVDYLCTSTSFTDDDLKLLKPYVYQVQGFNPGAFGDMSEATTGQSGANTLLEYLEEKFNLKRDVSSPEEYEQARLTVGANGQTYESSFVAGLQPEKEDSKFVTKITFENGTPKVTWEPALNGEGVKQGVRTYKVIGSKELNGPWCEVNGDEANYNFFKASVSLP